LKIYDEIQYCEESDIEDIKPTKKEKEENIE